MEYRSGENPSHPGHQIHYLESTIVERKETESPRYGIATSGYTLSSGAPTGTMVRLEGEKRWRRLMVWCFSNTSTAFLRHREISVIVNRLQQLPEEE